MQRAQRAGNVTAGDRPPPEPAQQRPPLCLPSLLNDLDGLARLLVERAAEGDLLNAFLLAAGMEQVTADHLERDRLRLRRAAARAERRLGRAGPPLAAALRAAARLLNRLQFDTRSVDAWQQSLQRLVDALADQLVAAGAWESRCRAPALEVLARGVAAGSAGLPLSLRRAVLRIPTCFRNLDQSPADVEELSRRFDAAWDLRAPAVAVVGIRTSGSYLAPLVAAHLRSFGWRDVRSRTLRPSTPPRRAVAAELRALGGGDGIAVLVDDSPRTWSALATAASDLTRLGFQPCAVAVAAPVLPGSSEPPKSLAQHLLVRLEWRDWDVCRRLRPSAVERELRGRLAGAIREVRRVEQPKPARAHASALFAVRVEGPAGVESLRIRVRGVGTGYFGEHTLAVARRLPGWVPAIHHLRAGLIYEEAGGPALREPVEPQAVAAVARYVADRGAALPVPEDLGPRLSHRGRVAEWAGEQLAPAFGRLAELGRLVTPALAARVLAVATPSVIDARMSLDAFHRSDRGLVKSDYDAGIFTGIDLLSFDPVFDLARAAVTLTEAAARDALRTEYEAITGTRIEPGRWLLLQVVNAVAIDGASGPRAHVAGERLPAAFQRYFGELLLADVQPSTRGPLCAIDIDGVLEEMRFGPSATTAAGALALRALSRHGFRPVLATGRSLPEVRERCAAYRLAGGVAEYGGAVLVGGSVVPMIGREERAALARLRRRLRGDGAGLDPRFQYSVRAFRVEAGRRRGLATAVAEEALVGSGAAGVLRAVPGRMQTDFVPVGVDKAKGLDVLAQRLGAFGEDRVSLAIGDTAADAGMLALAVHAFAPAGSDASLAASGARFLARQGPPAVAEAAARLLGHRPGGCPICACRLPQDRLLLDLLSLRDRTPAGRLVAMLRISAAALLAPPRALGQPAASPAPAAAEATPSAR